MSRVICRDRAHVVDFKDAAPAQFVTLTDTKNREARHV